MLLRFTKMQGLGNDFVVLDLITQRFNLQRRHILKIADRHFGIGCDQVLAVEVPLDPDVDFRYRIFNADGSEVEQCGNGARCFAKFVRDKKLTAKKLIKVSTSSGIIELEIAANNQIKVNMGPPVLEPENIPFHVAESSETSTSNDPRTNTYVIENNGEKCEIGVVSLGNPHAVIIVDNVQTADVATLGPAVETHSQFPQQVNVGFMQIVNRTEIHLRVHERGTGETLACGSGACAAVVSGHLRGLLDDKVRVHLPGGDLDIEWQGFGQPVMMTGPAASVFEGQILL
ncbi:MAG: diaminopimelate epimerase [Oceanicoccus sp.]|jgi:diaminopimelate epimerase